MLASLAVSETTSEERRDRHICISINRKKHKKGSDEAQWLKILTGNQKTVGLNLTFFKVNIKISSSAVYYFIIIVNTKFHSASETDIIKPSLFFSPSPINSLPYKDFLWSINQSIPVVVLMGCEHFHVDFYAVFKSSRKFTYEFRNRNCDIMRVPVTLFRIWCNLDLYSAFFASWPTQ